MNNTVSLCMIVKNEQSNIGILLDQVCPILEQVVIVDTGSTDGTLEILQQKTEQYGNLEIHHFEWVKDFAAARNFAFSKGNQEFLLFLDGDDQIDPGELLKFKNNFLPNPEVDCWILDYVYSRYPNGEPQTILGRERFLRRSKNPTWVGAIHETINISNFRTMKYDALKIIHNQAGKIVDLNRNIEILASEFDKNPNDPRTAYYYGKELFDRIDPKGIEVLKHFIGISEKQWCWYDDVCNALSRLAFDDLANNRLKEALQKADKIYHLDGSRLRAESYWVYGRVEQKLKNYKVAIRWFERCFDGQPPSPAVVNREYYTWNPAYQISECYLELGDFDNAVKWFDKIVETIPLTNQLVIDLEGRIFNKFFGDEQLAILEICDTTIRKDAIHTNYLIENDSNFGVGKFDGVVAVHAKMNNAYKLLKRRGFVWSLESVKFDDSQFGYLGKANFEGKEVHNYIRVNELLPRFYIHNGDWDFGPYRLRLGQLQYSLIKNGYPMHRVSHPIRGKDVSYCVSQNLHRFNLGDVKILDVCEWLPESDYSSFGIEMADMVSCSSPLLAKLMQEKFPNKTVFCVEDHVDFTEQEWL